MGAKRKVSAPPRNWTSTSSMQLVSLTTRLFLAHKHYVNPSTVLCLFIQCSDGKYSSTIDQNFKGQLKSAHILKVIFHEKTNLQWQFWLHGKLPDNTRFDYSSSSTVSTLYRLMDGKSLYCLSHQNLHLVIYHPKRQHFETMSETHNLQESDFWMCFNTNNTGIQGTTLKTTKPVRNKI